MKKIFTTIFISLVIGITFYAFLYYSEVGSLDEYENELSKSRFVLFLLNTIFLGISLNWLNHRAYKFIISKKLRSYAFFALFLVNIILIASLSFGLMKIDQIFTGISITTILDQYGTLLLNFSVLLVSFLIIYSIISFFVFSYIKYAEMQVEFIEHKKKQMELQLQVLEQQLSPHFLFNNLNTISALIYADKIKAENYIRKFASVYSTFSDTSANSLIGLKEELKFVKQYIFLLETRFQKSIHFKINIDEKSLDTFIVPMSIQTMIENAIKHNLFDDDNPLQINISIENGNIKVKNNYRPNNQTHESYKIGQKNILERYKNYSNKSPKFKIIENEYVAELPLLKNKINE